MKRIMLLSILTMLLNTAHAQSTKVEFYTATYHATPPPTNCECWGWNNTTNSYEWQTLYYDYPGWYIEIPLTTKREYEWAYCFITEPGVCSQWVQEFSTWYIGSCPLNCRQYNFTTTFLKVPGGDASASAPNVFVHRFPDRYSADKLSTPNCSLGNETVNNGTWSDASTWSGGQVPSNPANGFYKVGNTLACADGSIGSTGHVSIDLSGTFNITGPFVCNGLISFTNPNQLNNYAGISGSGTVRGDFNNAGGLSPGNSPGTFTIIGNYTAQNTATHNIEIASTSSYDIINISGAAALNGTLNISLLNGFEPNVGDQFPFMTYGSATGTFSTVNLPSLSGSKQWQINYNATNITLEVVNVLPLELLTFQAQHTEGGNVLTWQTAHEVNTSHFDIERSTDGQKFETISVQSVKNGTNNYTCIDKAPLSKTVFYRLKINDKDGQYSYSKTVSVVSQLKGMNVSVFPNPSSDIVNVRLDVEKKSDIKLELTDILGRTLWQSIIENTEGGKTLAIPVAPYPDGHYFLKVSDGYSMLLQKIVKN